ncbi:hypothetical protein OTU49_015759 [Cherax quadricarinatus]|uniref:C2H2-type domain-containing protein n=1 Tax=Cherax quadricarinatus TaxID=27406 RepID=A0AAW0YB46_CHEQU
MAALLQESSGTGGSGIRSSALLSCPNCPKTFSGPGRHQQYERHVIVHTGERPFVCPHCAYRANQLSNLRRHIKCIHQGQTHSGNNAHQGHQLGNTIHQGHQFGNSVHQFGNPTHHGHHFGNSTHQKRAPRDMTHITAAAATAVMPHPENVSSRNVEDHQLTTTSTSSFQHQYNRENFEGSGGQRH